MKKKIFLLILIIVLMYLYPSNNTIVQPINSSNLRSTLVTANFNTNIIKGKNLVFCSTINKTLKKIENYLNNTTIPNELDENSEQLILKENTIDIVVKAYFKKYITFNESYEKLKKPIDFYINENTFQVEGFGIENFDKSNSKHKLLKNQFEVIYFSFGSERTNKIIIKLLSKSNSDEIILSTAFIGKTLQESYEAIQDKVNNNKNQFKIPEKSNLKIPKIKFNILHIFQEFTGKNIKNKIIKNAQQEIYFSLDEAGLSLWAFTEIFFETKSTGLNIVFNGPFILYLKNKNEKLPYFMLYIDNDELLKR